MANAEKMPPSTAMGCQTSHSPAITNKMLRFLQVSLIEGNTGSVTTWIQVMTRNGNNFGVNDGWSPVGNRCWAGTDPRFLDLSAGHRKTVRP